jgi:dipeptidyl aminopeptidase/acylaminoacyl peptidase
MFTALRRQGVPAKLVIFPDEGHWIEKPQNSELWYKTFLDWLAAYLK